MSLYCFTCGKEMGDFTGDSTRLATCAECRMDNFYRAASNPGRLLRDIFLHHEYSDIIGIESDAGATRIYCASPQAIEQGVVMMHYVRSEEVPWTDDLKERIKWEPKP